MFLPLELTLRPSRVWRAVLFASHALALLGVWLAVLPPGMQAALSVAVAVSLMWAWREFSSMPRGLRVAQSGQVELLMSEWQSARIRGRPVVLPWLTSLELEIEGGKRCRIALLRDSTDGEGLRKLRVWLKWGRSAA